LKKIISILILSFFVINSCDRDKKATHPQNHISKEAKNDSLQNRESQQETFKTGKEPLDFITKDEEIQYEAEGDLNHDELTDKVLVLRKKSDTLAKRKVLILLKNNDKTYRLDITSEKVFPDEYNEAGYKMHDTEDISIDQGNLHINLYDIGPNGNQFSTFKYINGKLILTYIETYNMGAGSHSALNYEPLKGRLTQETVSTMEENTPSTTKTFQVKKESYLFEKASPEDIIRKVYHSVSID